MIALKYLAGLLLFRDEVAAFSKIATAANIKVD